MGFLAGKRAVVTGLASNRSIAWGIAQAMRREGAELALSYQSDKLRSRVEDMAAELGSDLTLPLDVADDAQIDAFFAGIAKRWDGFDILVHSVAFAPADQLQVDLLRFLQSEFGHVSWERVLSGPGLASIYRFLQGRAGHAAPAWLHERLQREDAGAVVGEVGLSGRDPVCTQALDLFVSIYGAQAGNLALESLALGGVVVGGGIAPKIAPALSIGAFRASFEEKGRMTSYLAPIPVYVIRADFATLKGAAAALNARLSATPKV